MNEIVRMVPAAGTGPERAAPRLDKPFKLTLCVTQTCNMDCKLCYADCGATTGPGKPIDGRGEMTTAEWKAVIDELVAENFLHIFIEGGEPFHRPDFEELIAYIDKRMFIAIRTHGHLIDGPRARRLKELAVGRVYVDLFSAEEAVQDELTGTPGSYQASLEGIRHLRAAGIKVTLLGILSRRNHLALQRYPDLAQELNCDQVGILRLYPLGRARKNWAELSLTLDEMMTALHSLKVPDGVSLMQSWHPRDGNCCWQTSAISPFGDSIGCPYMREYVNYGNVRETKFVDTFNDPLWTQLRRNEVEESCPECSATQGTHGGCRSTAYAFSGRHTAPDPYCETLNKGVDLRVLPEWLVHKDA